MRGKTLLLLYILVLIPIISYSKGSDGKKKILFICSYSTDNEYSRTNISSFINTFSELQGDYQYATEALNCTSLDDRYRWVDYTRAVMEKHKDAAMVVLIGTEALVSYFSQVDPEIRKIPVFATMGQRYCASMEGNEIPILYDKNVEFGLIDILGTAKQFNLQLFYYYDYEVKKDIELIKQFFPKTENIAILSDNSLNGLSHMRQIKSEVKKNFKNLKLKYIDGRKLNTDQAAERFKNLPENTSVMLCCWKYDKNNIVYMDNSKYTFIKANPNMPVFSLTGTGIGYWAIGGYIPQYRPLGMELAKKAYDYLETEDWNGPFISGYSDILKLDMHELKRLDLMDANIPSDVIYVNPDFDWGDYVRLYKWYFILGSGIFILISIGFIYSSLSNIHIRRLKHNLEKKDEQLEQEKNELLKYQKELIVAKDKADELSRLQSAFISNMSHEIRTPLNAIVGFSEVLISTIDPTEEQDEYIGIIQHNSDLLLKLINDILDLSRIEAKKKKLFFEKADIVPHLESVVLSMRPNAKENVNILFTHKEPSITVVTDLVRLQQVVINLIGNAIKFTDNGSITLDVENRPDEEMMLLSVTDTGCGIPADMQDKVFERFNKVNEFAQGTGLGLAICEATVKQFGGKIWIDKSYTSGTRFIFTIPTNHNESSNEE
jgi:signal transduction histidine kinase